MKAATLISVEEYLSTSYRPDCDYIDGEVRERNLGEKAHSRVQFELGRYVDARYREMGIWVWPEQRVQVSARRFRIPDLCITLEDPPEQIFVRPPFICIEILSKDDTFEDTYESVRDYLNFGVPYVWVVDPNDREVIAYSAQGARNAIDGILRTADPEIIVDLSEVFAAMERKRR